MSEPIDLAVSGGSGGIVANRAALVQLSGVYRSAAAALGLDVMQLSSEADRLGNAVFGGDYGGAGRLDAAGLLRSRASLDDAIALLRAAADTIGDLGVKVGWAARGYPWGKDALDVGLLDNVAGLLAVPSSLAGAVSNRSGGGPTVAGQDPRTIDVAIGLAGVPALSRGVGGPDGHGVAVATGSGAVPSPRGLGDLVRGLGEVDRASGGGNIDVRVVVGADGRRHAIVDITGTRVWHHGGTDPADLPTNALAMTGRDTAYAQGVLAALRHAGVRRDEPVMLVGHSQGGMIAVNVAAEARRSGEFDVTHVVTAGSPVSLTVRTLPKSVRVLSLENRHDAVPRLDGAPNPDRRNVTTVTGTSGDGSAGGSHAIDESYRPIADAADRSTSRSVRDFARSGRGFFDGVHAESHRYRVERS